MSNNISFKGHYLIKPPESIGPLSGDKRKIFGEALKTGFTINPERQNTVTETKNGFILKTPGEKDFSEKDNSNLKAVILGIYVRLSRLHETPEEIFNLKKRVDREITETRIALTNQDKPSVIDLNTPHDSENVQRPEKRRPELRVVK